MCTVSKCDEISCLPNAVHKTLGTIGQSIGEFKLALKRLLRRVWAREALADGQPSVIIGRGGRQTGIGRGGSEHAARQTGIGRGGSRMTGR